MFIFGVIVCVYIHSFDPARLQRFLSLINGNAVVKDVDWRDLLVFKFVGWYIRHGKSSPKQRKEIRERCEYVLGKYLFANQIESDKLMAETKEIFPLPLDTAT